MIQIAQGAEAVLYRDRGTIIKERLSKEYRHPQLDQALRSFRTRREAKILQKLEELNFPAPHMQEFSDKRMNIIMDFIPGEKLRDILAQGDHFQQLAEQMGEKIGKLHANHIIHGDLTTSNMIKHEKTGEITFIDFGLSSFSEKEEDKAVDLHLLEQALESTHYQLYPEIFERVLEGYKRMNQDAEKVLARLHLVQKRGRNKNK
ncbi:MAG: KEOPS complex kinase/ATPase Bud32 [Nanoarchaeota archaeon]